MLKSLSDKRAILLALLIISLYISPYIILGEDAYVTIHDFLDTSVAHVKAAITIGLNGDRRLPVLDGVPSSIIIPPYPIDVKNLLYLIFPTYWAIIANIFFVKMIAFLGMYYLLKSYLLDGNYLISFVVSVMFSLIPFYADYGLSSAGVPLFMWAALNLEYEKKQLWSYFILFFFAINSFLVLVGFCLCNFWLVWVVYKVLICKQIPKRHIIGLSVVLLGYSYSIIPLFLDTFYLEAYVSHRAEFINHSSVWGDLRFLLELLVESQYHAGSFLALPLLFLIFAVFIIEKKRNHSIKHYVLLFTIIVLMILLGRFYAHLPFKLIQSFQFDRFYFLFPALCFMMLAKAICISRKRNLVLITSLVLFFISFGLYNKSFRKNVRIIANLDNHKYPSYRQFFDTNLFDMIKKDIASEYRPYECKVVSLGLYPAIAEYNGFYTLDSYVANYSLDYKHKFRKVIGKELDKNSYLKEYFDDWGSRCYLFSSEIGTDLLNPQWSEKNVKSLDIDTNTLKLLGCEYILSAVDIDNYRDLNLEFIKSYTTDHSYYKIRVYKVG